MFREPRLDLELTDKSRERYEAERQVAEWRKVAELIDDPRLGLKIAQAWSSTDLHAPGNAFLAGATRRIAPERLSRNAQVLSDTAG